MTDVRSSRRSAQVRDRGQPTSPIPTLQLLEETSVCKPVELGEVDYFDLAAREPYDAVVLRFLEHAIYRLPGGSCHRGEVVLSDRYGARVVVCVELGESREAKEHACLNRHVQSVEQVA